MYRSKEDRSSIHPLLKYCYALQGDNKRVKKSNHLVWSQNRVKLLFFAHQLGGNIHLFTLTTITNPWCHLFLSKITIQKMLRNAKNCHIKSILAIWLQQMAYYWLFWHLRAPQYNPGWPLEWDSHYLWSLGVYLVNKIKLDVQNDMNCFKFSCFETSCNDFH